MGRIFPDAYFHIGAMSAGEAWLADPEITAS